MCLKQIQGKVRVHCPEVVITSHKAKPATTKGSIHIICKPQFTHSLCFCRRRLFAGAGAGLSYKPLKPLKMHNTLQGQPSSAVKTTALLVTEAGDKAGGENVGDLTGQKDDKKKSNHEGNERG